MCDINEKVYKKHGGKINRVILDSLKTSTSHSLPRIIRAKHLLIKTIWILASLFCISCCCFIITSSINEYLKYDVVTKIRVYAEDESPFPMVAFCNKDPIITDKGRIIFLNYLKSINITDYEDKLTSNVDLSNAFDRALTFLANNLTIEQKQSIGYSIEEMVISCKFNFKYCDADLSEFVWFYDNEFGNCFKFNVGINERRISSTYGRTTGLRLVLFVGIENSKSSLNYYELTSGKILITFLFTLYISSQFYFEITKIGITLTVTNSSIEPNMYESYAIATNSENYINVHRLFLKKKQKPFSDCLSDLKESKSHLVKYFFDNNMTYRFKECSDLLIQDDFYKICKCASVYYKNLHNSRYCTTNEDYECLKANGYLSKLSKEEKNELCPVECYSTSLSLDISSSSPFTPTFIKNLRNNTKVISKFEDINSVTDEQIANSIVVFDVYYNNLEYTEILEVPFYSIIDLISNIGGTFGLFLGISILSFIEIVELIFNIIMTHFDTKIEVSSSSSSS
jgi:hypothetical protein